MNMYTFSKQPIFVSLSLDKKTKEFKHRLNLTDELLRTAPTAHNQNITKKYEYITNTLG